MTPKRELMARERLHLLFLRQLAQRLADRTYAVKGGANLRFWLGSPRFSEDIDLDVADVAAPTLAKHTNAILASPALVHAMTPAGVRQVHVQPAATRKDTETTQRWKVHLDLEGTGDVGTKIEFSRRGMNTEPEGDAPDPIVLTAHRLQPFIAKHYGAPHAVAQKVAALADPKRRAVRDVFDLHHLAQVARSGFDAAVAAATPVELDRACRKTLGFSIQVFEAEVGAFLPEAEAAPYRRDPKLWERLQLEVVELLGGEP